MVKLCLHARGGLNVSSIGRAGGGCIKWLLPELIGVLPRKFKWIVLERGDTIKSIYHHDT